MLKRIIDTVKKAGEIYKSAGDDLGIEDKGSAVNLVTKYDKMIHDFYSASLKKSYPAVNSWAKRATVTRS